MSLLAIIPARCGSKGIPFKNIVDVCGKPLIQYTIEIALELKSKKLVTEVIVSTDCEEIATIARKSGVNVPFLRPNNIAGDLSRSTDYISHALGYFEENQVTYDTFMVLQPTSPLKTYDDVASAINIFQKNNNKSLISVYKEETINNLIMYSKEGDIAIPLEADHNKGVRRQDHGAVYIRNGAIYITNVEYFKTKKNIISELPLMYEMKKNNSINIDTFADLEYVRKILCK